MAADNPQLVMRRPDLKGLPEIQLPSPYSIRHFKPGDEQPWNDIVRDSFQSDWFDFNRTVKSMPSFQPERILFVEGDGKLIATASLFLERKLGSSVHNPVNDGIGFLHIVAVRPSHQGKKLGYWVNLAVLHRMADEGLKEAQLATDDHRIPAIKTYLSLGFTPYPVHANHDERWRLIFKSIIIDGKFKTRLHEIISGDLYSIND